MATDILETINQAQRERLSYIDFRLDFYGEMNRGDLISRFGIKDAAATRDITLYRKIAKQNVEYDNQARIYLRRETYQPLFPRNPKQILSALSSGFGDSFIGNDNTVIPCESPVELGLPNMELLAQITRAIHQNEIIAINYLSFNSGESYREIAPHSLVNNGLRWHVRAFDRKNNRFADFVINRITSVDGSISMMHPSENADEDLDWNTTVDLEIVPHPNLKHSDSIKQEYNIKGDSLVVSVRAAMAAYTLRRWNVDCSSNHVLEGSEYHLWLKNTDIVQLKASLTIAPGKTSNKKY
jgi:hypothetical protein